MKHMTAPGAPALAQSRCCDIDCNFVRDTRNKIWLFFRRGNGLLMSPTLEDRTIFHEGRIATPAPIETVTLIHPHDLGITELAWTDTKPSDLEALPGLWNFARTI